MGAQQNNQLGGVESFTYALKGQSSIWQWPRCNRSVSIVCQKQQSAVLGQSISGHSYSESMGWLPVQHCWRIWLPVPLQILESLSTLKNIQHLWSIPNSGGWILFLRKILSHVPATRESQVYQIEDECHGFAVDSHVCFIHKLVKNSGSRAGALSRWLVNPSSKCIVSPVAWSKMPVGSSS